MSTGSPASLSKGTTEPLRSLSTSSRYMCVRPSSIFRSSSTSLIKSSVAASPLTGVPPNSGRWNAVAPAGGPPTVASMDSNAWVAWSSRNSTSPWGISPSPGKSDEAPSLPAAGLGPTGNLPASFSSLSISLGPSGLSVFSTAGPAPGAFAPASWSRASIGLGSGGPASGSAGLPAPDDCSRRSISSWLISSFSSSHGSPFPAESAGPLLFCEGEIAENDRSQISLAEDGVTFLKNPAFKQAQSGLGQLGEVRAADNHQDLVA